LPKGEVPEALFKPKSASVHYLSIIPRPDIEIGIFESTIWNRFDSTGIHPPSAYAAIPVIGLHSSLEGLDAKNNSMLGVNLRFSPFKKIKLYGQLAMDQGSFNRLGWQAGMQVFDLALTGLHAQLEYNYTPDFFYASRFDLQSVSHSNQAMGHPGGGALGEQIAIINYRKKRWMSELRVTRITQSIGPQANFNADPTIKIETITEFGSRELYQAGASISWIVQPQTCTAISVGATWRQENVLETSLPLFSAETRYIWIGLKSNLLNHYSDF
jgi:hypothetical protein